MVTLCVTVFISWNVPLSVLVSLFKFWKVVTVPYKSLDRLVDSRIEPVISENVLLLLGFVPPSS